MDVLTATHVAAINAPHDQQQEEGTSDVQQTQQIVCSLPFEDTLKNAQTGDKLDLRSPYTYASVLQQTAMVGSMSVRCEDNALAEETAKSSHACHSALMPPKR